MDIGRFQEALQDLMSPGNILDELVEDWKRWISEALNEIALGILSALEAN